MNDVHNRQMVDRMIADGSLWAPAVVAAFRATPRHRFLDRVFVYQRKREQWKEIITRDPNPEHLRLMYSDRALITSLGGRGQPVPISSSSQPSLTAQMLQDLEVGPCQRILEVGAGTGYNAALLAHLVSPPGASHARGEVISIDVDRDVLSQAWDHLRSFPARHVKLHHADGRCGFAESAPYDRIMVTASTPDVEPAWLEQLAPGGRLLLPLMLAPGLEFIVTGTVREGAFAGRLTRAAYFMPLRNEGEVGTSFQEGPHATDTPQRRPAPWVGWFERRRLRQSWTGFSQSLALFGLLRGLSIHFRSLENDPCVFGISRGDIWCWLASREWHYNIEAGRELAWQLWLAFLDAGGPWPTDYRLTASFAGGLAPTERCFLRQGSRCLQRWELPEKRERPAWM